MYKVLIIFIILFWERLLIKIWCLVGDLEILKYVLIFFVIFDVLWFGLLILRWCFFVKGLMMI